ncbi:MAG: hypothetical protein ABSF71_31815, partial [Terriglobia bacterium]
RHTQRDVKNEGTSGDEYENKGKTTKCLATNSASHTKMHQSHANRDQSVGLLGRTYIGFLIKEDDRWYTVDGRRGEGGRFAIADRRFEECPTQSDYIYENTAS